ncbi:MAG: FAD-dependent oxidoreductase [Bryobacteraceae bacterium]|nr:FAD-dependent oxidoreductase [Bryobacteraceae bacterium]
MSTGSGRFDVAVIGAGVFGAWTAYTLARSGARVVLVDAFGAANARASSGDESRIIRMCYGPDEIYTRWSARSLRMWREFFAEMGREELFQPCGVLWMAPRGHEGIAGSRAVLARCGVRFEEMEAQGIARRFPQIAPAEGCCGIYEPDSGALLARQAVRAVVEAAVRAGVVFEREAVSGVADAKRRYGGGTLVFACGAWLGGLFPEVLGGRLFATRQPVFYFGPRAGDRRFSSPEMPCWVDETEPGMPYGLPDMESHGVKLGWHEQGESFDPDSGERVVGQSEVESARTFLGARFPPLAGAPLVGARVCQYENTGTGDFVIDRHPELRNVWLVGGGSGHGFKHGPAVGEYVAGRLAGTVREERRFALVRMEEGSGRRVY